MGKSNTERDGSLTSSDLNDKTSAAVCLRFREEIQCKQGSVEQEAVDMKTTCEKLLRAQLAKNTELRKIVARGLGPPELHMFGRLFLSSAS